MRLQGVGRDINSSQHPCSFSQLLMILSLFFCTALSVQLQLELYRNCERILRADRDQLLQRLLKSQSRGIRIDPSKTGTISCLICAQPFVRPPIACKPPVVDEPNRHTVSQQPHEQCYVFRCQHVYHSACLQSLGIRSCPQCSER